MLWFPRFLAFASGFISLSLEILWVRYAAFAYRGAPQAFSFVLGMYLIGIAAGAALGRRCCRQDADLTTTAGRYLLLAGGLDLLLPWAAAAGLLAGSISGFAGIAAAVTITALLKSVVFPIAHHLGSTGANRVGASVSKVYFANIAGSTLGPLVTGFVLLEVLSLQQNLMLFAVATVALGIFCLSRVRAVHPLWSGAAFAVGLTVLLAPSALLPMLIEAKADAHERGTLHNVIENRHGIIHTVTDASGVDVVYGSNVYDGGINVDLLADTNGVSRAYILAVLHPAPKRILVIGLAGGAWTRVLSGFAGVEQMDVVEINPGYLQLVREYPVVAPLLDDPR
jgi:hypothetical protein